MTFKSAFRFLLIPALISTLVVAGLNLLIRWIIDTSSLELNEGILIGWIPGVLGASAYFLLVHHRLRLFFSKKSNRTEGFIILAIAFFSFSGVAIQLGYEDFQWELKEIKSINHLNQSQKNCVWKIKGRFSSNNLGYLGDFQEYTSGKHPQTQYLSYGLLHLVKEDIWLLFTNYESISTSESEGEKNEVFNRMREKSWKQLQELTSSKTIKTHFLIPLHESEDLQYAFQTLKEYEDIKTLPNRIYLVKQSFEQGLTEPHIWMICTSIGLILIYFFLFCLFGRKVIFYNEIQIGIINFSFLAVVTKHFRDAPITCLILLTTLGFFIVEIVHEPNIMSVKSNPYLLKWTISKEVWSTHEWYRFLTYPFTNVYLYNKVFDVLIFVLCSYSLEKRLSKFHFLMLLIVTQFAGGFAAASFNHPFNCGLTVYSIVLTSFYLFTGFQKQIGFSQWKYIGLTLLIFGLFLGTATEFLEYQKLIAASIVGFGFGPFLTVNKEK